MRKLKHRDREDFVHGGVGAVMDVDETLEDLREQVAADCKRRLQKEFEFLCRDKEKSDKEKRHK